MAPKSKRNSHVTVHGVHNISIGGDAEGNMIVTGDHSQIRQAKITVIEETEINNAIRNRQRLLDLLIQRLSSNEISMMSFELGLDYDLLMGNTKATTTITLINAIERKALFPKFLKILKNTRPDIFDIVTTTVLDDDAG